MGEREKGSWGGTRAIDLLFFFFLGKTRAIDLALESKTKNKLNKRKNG